MSLRASLVLIEGDRSRDVERLLGAVGLRLVAVPRSAPTYSAATKTLLHAPAGARLLQKALGRAGGWTVLIDPDGEVACDPHACHFLSQRARASVLGLLIDAVADRGAFVLARRGVLRAVLHGPDGTLHEEGTPIPEEDGLDRTHFTADCALRVLERVALPWSVLEDSKEWQVLSCAPQSRSRSHEMVFTAGASAAAGGADPSHRPWWRFWGA
jgi:hypothetical protein